MLQHVFGEWFEGGIGCDLGKRLGKFGECLGCVLEEIGKSLTSVKGLFGECFVGVRLVFGTGLLVIWVCLGGLDSACSRRGWHGLGKFVAWVPPYSL